MAIAKASLTFLVARNQALETRIPYPLKRKVVMDNRMEEANDRGSFALLQSGTARRKRTSRLAPIGERAVRIFEAVKNCTNPKS